MVPSPAELNYFLEVSTALNFTRASQKIGMSQPSLSLAIKRLEQSVGTILFIRHKQGVTLTKAGKKLLAQIKPLLQLWENTKSEALEAHQEVQGQIILGCHSIIALFVHEFIPDLLEKYSRLTIQFKHDISQKITEKVIDSSIDIGIVINPIKHPSLIIRKLNDSETTFWRGTGSREIQNLFNEHAVIICNPDIVQTQFLLKEVKLKNIKTTRYITSSSMEVIASLTVNGCGIGILPACFIQSLYPGKLKRIPNAPTYLDEIYLIYRNENRNIKAIEVIIKAIKKAFQY